MLKIDIQYNNVYSNINPNFNYWIDNFLNIKYCKEFNFKYNHNILYKEKIKPSKIQNNLIYDNNTNNIYIKRFLNIYI